MASYPPNLDGSIQRIFSGLSPLLTPTASKLGLPLEAVIEVYCIIKMPSHALTDETTATRYPPANLQARLTGVAQRYQLSAKDMARLVSAVGSIVAGKRDAIAQHLSTGGTVTNSAHRLVKQRRPTPRRVARRR
jgi:hypothetical protein